MIFMPANVPAGPPAGKRKNGLTELPSLDIRANFILAEQP
jgi:hypothetical protein